MAFPQVVTEANSEEESADVTTHDVTLPASLVSGNLIVLAVIIDGNASTIGDPSGFTKFTGFPVVDGANSVHVNAWWKISDGLEGSATSFTTVNGQRSEHKAWQISGHDSGQAPEGAGAAQSTVQNADPPSVTPTGGAKDYLWLAIGGKDRGAEPFTVFPSNYTNTAESNMTAFDLGGVCIAWGRRELNAASEDAGQFQWTGTNRATVGALLAIHPAAEAPVALLLPMTYPLTQTTLRM